MGGAITVSDSVVYASAGSLLAKEDAFLFFPYTGVFSVAASGRAVLNRTRVLGGVAEKGGALFLGDNASAILQARLKCTPCGPRAISTLGPLAASAALFCPWTHPSNFLIRRHRCTAATNNVAAAAATAAAAAAQASRAGRAASAADVAMLPPLLLPSAAQDTVLTGGVASLSGGALYASAATVVLIDCTIANASARMSGGGIFLEALSMLLVLAAEGGGTRMLGNEADPDSGARPPWARPPPADTLGRGALR